MAKHHPIIQPYLKYKLKLNPPRNAHALANA
jgi:hypothetical protein